MIIDYRLVNLDDKEIMECVSKLSTTFRSINPYLDNINLIKDKLLRKNVFMYSVTIEQKLIGLFLFEKAEFSDESAVIDFLNFSNYEIEKLESIMIDFISTIQKIYNISIFLKYKEINDKRINIFEKIGFTEIANLRKHLFFNRQYHDQKVYRLERT